jgi:hypothetical protein
VKKLIEEKDVKVSSGIDGGVLGGVGNNTNTDKHPLTWELNIME